MQKIAVKNVLPARDNFLPREDSTKYAPSWDRNVNYSTNNILKITAEHTKAPGQPPME